MDFENKVAVVTGGGTGIGWACARRLARGGARVVVAGDDERTEAGAAALRDERLTVSARRVDVSQAAGVRDLIEHCVAAFGGLDVVVNAAAVQPYGTVESTGEADWDRVLAVNLKSVYLSGHYAVAHMRRRGGGAIVNIASVQGIACQTNVAAYAASKGGMLALTRAMALDHAADNIRVNAVCPGSIDTPMLRYAAAENRGQRGEDEVIAEWGRQHPAGRVGHPGEVAEMVAFLAGPLSGFCTGGEYRVDGGLLAKLGVVLPE